MSAELDDLSVSKQVGRQAGDDIAEPVYVKNGRSPFGFETDPVADFGGHRFELSAAGDMGGDGREDVSTVKCIAQRPQKERIIADFPDARSSRGSDQRKQSIVGKDKGVPLNCGGNGTTTTSDTGINHGDVDGSLGEPSPTLRKQIRSL